MFSLFFLTFLFSFLNSHLSSSKVVTENPTDMTREKLQEFLVASAALVFKKARYFIGKISPTCKLLNMRLVENCVIWRQSSYIVRRISGGLLISFSSGPYFDICYFTSYSFHLFPLQMKQSFCIIHPPDTKRTVSRFCRLGVIPFNVYNCFS